MQHSPPASQTKTSGRYSPPDYIAKNSAKYSGSMPQPAASKQACCNVILGDKCVRHSCIHSRKVQHDNIMERITMEKYGPC